MYLEDPEDRGFLSVPQPPDRLSSRASPGIRVVQVFLRNPATLTQLKAIAIGYIFVVISDQLTGCPGDPAMPSTPRSPGGPGEPSRPLSPRGPAGPYVHPPSKSTSVSKIQSSRIIVFFFCSIMISEHIVSTYRLAN